MKSFVFVLLTFVCALTGLLAISIDQLEESNNDFIRWILDWNLILTYRKNMIFLYILEFLWLLRKQLKGGDDDEQPMIQVKKLNCRMTLMYFWNKLLVNFFSVILKSSDFFFSNNMVSQYPLEHHHKVLMCFWIRARPTSGLLHKNVKGKFYAVSYELFIYDSHFLGYSNYHSNFYDTSS